MPKLKNVFFVIQIKIVFRHFRNYSSIFLEFLPQFIFLVLLFGYMVALMFLKWVIFSAFNGNYYL